MMLKKMTIRSWTVLRALPATTGVVALLGAAALWLSAQPLHDQVEFIRQNSSNLHNLRHRMWWTVFTSGLVVDELPVLFGIGAVAAALGAVEWRWGSARALGVFCFGHVAATLITEGVVWLMGHADLPTPCARDHDVGISYGLVATVAYLMSLVGERTRRYGLRALAMALAAAWAVNQELADAGHLVALGLGALAARSRWARSRGRRPAAGPVAKAASATPPLGTESLRPSP
ncbi:rhomboid-like protein [Streptomyces sp. NPDC052496]|uniref:rhomboid-like protein n=1 Tax=Streptomyces sp. NPDC052496 TaxID=3154951 RepID=UPI00343223E3